MELVTRQPMVGNFKQPGPSWTAAERQGNLKHPGPSVGANGHMRGMRGGREGGREGSTNVHTACLGASLALRHHRLLPQAITIGATQPGATHYGCCRASRAPGCREERGRELEEERSQATETSVGQTLSRRSPVQLPKTPFSSLFAMA